MKVRARETMVRACEMKVRARETMVRACEMKVRARETMVGACEMKGGGAPSTPGARAQPGKRNVILAFSALGPCPDWTTRISSFHITLMYG